MNHFVCKKRTDDGGRRDERGAGSVRTLESIRFYQLCLSTKPSRSFAPDLACEWPSLFKDAPFTAGHDTITCCQRTHLPVECSKPVCFFFFLFFLEPTLNFLSFRCPDSDSDLMGFLKHVSGNPESSFAIYGWSRGLNLKHPFIWLEYFRVAYLSKSEVCLLLYRGQSWKWDLDHNQTV